MTVCVLSIDALPNMFLKTFPIKGQILWTPKPSHVSRLLNRVIKDVVPVENATKNPHSWEYNF